MNVVKGVVYSEDFPLNVYHETLLQNKILHSIKMNLAKKYLEMLAKITELNDDYKKFYEQFGKRLKLGIQKNFIDGAKIAGLLRLNTHKPGDEQISFNEYEDQLAMDTKFLQSLKTRCSETNEEFDRRVADRQAELKAVVDAIGILNSDTSFDTYDKTVSTDVLQMSPLAGEQALRQRALPLLRDAMNKVVDDPVVQVMWRRQFRSHSYRSEKICARRVMRYSTWLTLWMILPCNSTRSATE